MNRLARIFGAAFPVSDHRAIADAKTRDAEADRAALTILAESSPVKGIAKIMSNVATIPHRPLDDGADQQIAALMSKATAAAESTGETFRKAMQQIVETQSREIERLRAIIEDVARDRPRKIVQLASVTIEREKVQHHRLAAVANDGTMWTLGQQWPDYTPGWERLADLPQPDAGLKA